jgi:hypothetical protein
MVLSSKTALLKIENLAQTTSTLDIALPGPGEAAHKIEMLNTN